MENNYYPARYSGLTILQEAKKKREDGFGYRASRKTMLWKSKKTSWNWLMFEWGIHWGKSMWFPFRYHKSNCSKQFTMGIWKYHVTLLYHF